MVAVGNTRLCYALRIFALEKTLAVSPIFRSLAAIQTSSNVGCPNLLLFQPYTCGIVSEIRYTTVRTITDNSTTRMPTSTYRGARARAAWRRRGTRSEVKHAEISSKRLPTGSVPVRLPGASTSSSSSVVPSVAYSGDSFVRLVTLRLSVNPRDQPYAHLATANAAGCRSNGKCDGSVPENVYIDVTYHDVDGVLDFLILRHLFDAAIRRQWKRGVFYYVAVLE